MNAFKRNILLITVIGAAMMELIDTSIVNVALSHMGGNLGATLEDTSWVITSYAIANVIVIPITSFLALKLGRRNYYIGSVILFTICSFLCGQATNIWMLVAFRFLQGMGGGALLSVSQAIVFELFPKEKRNVASALFGIGVFIGPTIGPTLGGVITEYYSWPWIFYINVPIGITVAVLCSMLLHEPSLKQEAGRSTGPVSSCWPLASGLCKRSWKEGRRKIGLTPIISSISPSRPSQESSSLSGGSCGLRIP